MLIYIFFLMTGLLFELKFDRFGGLLIFQFERLSTLITSSSPSSRLSLVLCFYICLLSVITNAPVVPWHFLYVFSPLFEQLFSCTLTYCWNFHHASIPALLIHATSLRFCRPVLPSVFPPMLCMSQLNASQPCSFFRPFTKHGAWLTLTFACTKFRFKPTITCQRRPPPSNERASAPVAHAALSFLTPQTRPERFFRGILNDWDIWVFFV